MLSQEAVHVVLGNIQSLSQLQTDESKVFKVAYKIHVFPKERVIPFGLNHPVNIVTELYHLKEGINRL